MIAATNADYQMQLLDISEISPDKSLANIGMAAQLDYKGDFDDDAGSHFKQHRRTVAKQQDSDLVNDSSDGDEI